jgi:hypothetical protein
MRLSGLWILDFGPQTVAHHCGGGGVRGRETRDRSLRARHQTFGTDSDINARIYTVVEVLPAHIKSTSANVLDWDL